MRIGIWIIFILMGFGAIAQQPGDLFDYQKPNLTYLEFLTWQEINQLREKQSREALRPDSLLLLAARDHARYIKRTGKQSHFQKGDKAKEDPQLRIEYYGCHQVLAGENILYIPAEKNILVRLGRTEKELKTYEEYARAMASVWKNSKPHYGNILSRDFSVSALAVSYDQEKHALYAVQVFGEVTGDHPFTQTAEDFPFFPAPGVQKKN